MTLVDGTHGASVSPDGSAEGIALVEDLGLDGGAADGRTADGGVPPHPETDARSDPPPAASDDDDDDDDGPGNGKGKGKPPKKKE